MTREELKQKLSELGTSKAFDVLEGVCSCIYEGRAMMTSSEILDMVCDTLKEAGLDDGDEWAPEEDDT
jgi:hypothetical protein